MKISDLPFRERPVLELLNLEADREEPDPDYAGYGWARVPSISLDEHEIADALVLALHSADDGEPMPDDIALEFELPGAGSVLVLLSQFLAEWLPRLPRASAVVLAMCNPHGATLEFETGVPVYYADGDVESWLDESEGPHPDRLRLAAEGSWARLAP
ncbi:MAG: hypothetical protein HOV81_40245 [Kofleriaceae bacterium]|nr:hypothetical protein [Kofleriaceae bacterium]